MEPAGLQLTTSFTVRSYESDADGALPAYALLNYFEECAQRHAEGLGYGFDRMKAQGWLWILARIRVEISRYPARRESVAIETWPRELVRVFAMRDFLVRNLENEVIARATSAWLILNAEQGRPLRPETIVDSARFAPNAGVRAVQSDPSKLSSPGVDAGEIARFAVTPSDIDVNKHVNNAVYMRWIDDALRIRRDDRSIDTIELNFMQAGTYPGDVSVVAELGNPTVGEIRGDDAGEPLVRFSLDRGPESGVP